MQLTQSPPCPTSLSDEQIATYRAQGYLAFEQVLTPEEVEKSKAALSTLVQRVAHSPDKKKKGPFWGAPGSKLGIQFEPGYTPDETDADLELKVRKLMWYYDQDPHLEFLATAQRRIHAILEALVGPQPILFQDMALIKPPFIGSEKPWHQDDAYFSVTPLDAVIGVWIALDGASCENGCMHVVPGGHRMGPLRHHHASDCEIVDGRIDPSKVEPVELAPGGAMFFHGLIPHQTPPNSSPDRRRALQFHYRSATSQIIDPADYNRVFAEADGTPASCATARPAK